MSKNKRLFEVYKEFVLSSDSVVQQALDSLPPKKRTAEYVKNNFSEILDELGSRAYQVFLTSQKQAWAKAIEEYVPQVFSQSPSQTEVAHTLGNHFEEFNKFFLSIVQSRKARAGIAFETHVGALFKLLRYPFSEQPVTNGKPDFVLPSFEYFKKNAIDCIIFTTKRTLRERWRQIVTEGSRGLGFFLATIDPDVSERAIDEMSRNRIYLVVPAKSKTDVPAYAEKSNVMSFETFFTDYVDPAMVRWKKAHVA